MTRDDAIQILEANRPASEIESSIINPNLTKRFAWETISFCVRDCRNRRIPDRLALNVAAEFQGDADALARIRKIYSVPGAGTPKADRHSRRDPKGKTQCKATYADTHSIPIIGNRRF